MIRKFHKSDAKECSRIMNACQRIMPEFNSDQVEFLVSKYTPEYIEKEYPRYFALVFEDKGQIRGVGMLMDSEIRGLYIDPKFHCKGCGKSLLNALEDEARAQGLDKVITKSYYGPEKFYEKMGYKKVKEDAAGRGKISFPYVLMEKKLS
ncbi:GNAT family N-acetyltransferase [Candidatus Peregrinibacteria bacterium]|nr:GNAT family N-acetyltransferase [Candidatus Peregrinibacteria bacterium]